MRLTLAHRGLFVQKRVFRGLCGQFIFLLLALELGVPVEVLVVAGFPLGHRQLNVVNPLLLVYSVSGISRCQNAKRVLLGHLDLLGVAWAHYGSILPFAR